VVALLRIKVSAYPACLGGTTRAKPESLTFVGSRCMLLKGTS
jgi:hypothetical protein